MGTNANTLPATRDTDIDKPGLHQVWPPLESRDPTSYDLVLVHGLAGGSMSTWTATEDSNVCWPKWLSSSISGLRIYTFGYDARQAYLKVEHEHSNETDRIFTFAEELCVQLSDERVQQQNPIAFVGHGIGGLVIKKALVQCNARRNLFGNIVNSTHHIVFLDTPHHGVDLAIWQAIYGDLTDEAKEQLGLWSCTVAEMNREFGGIFSNLYVTTAYATRPTITPTGEAFKAVEEASAGLDFNHESMVRLTNVSHLTMTKFLNPDDVNYERLRKRIVTEIDRMKQSLEDNRNIKPISHQNTWEQLKEIRQAMGSNLGESIGQIQADMAATARIAAHSEEARELERLRVLRDEILGWLSPPGKKPRDKDWAPDLEKHLEALVNGSCSWILGLDDYKKWLQAPDSRLAWLHGIQGCGKSSLMAFLIDKFQSSGANVAYTFCRADAKLNAAGRLAELTKQMVLQSPDVFRALIPRHKKTTSTNITSMKTAKAVIKDAGVAFGECVLFVDALDECTDRKVMVEALQDIVKSIPSGVKILCSSRNEADIERHLKGKSGVTDLEVTPEKIEKDIRLLVYHDIDANLDLSERLLPRPDVRKNLIETLRNGAQGMFLLPRLMIKEMGAKTTIDQISDFLQNLPSGLHPFYLRKLEQIQNTDWRKMAKRSLTWIAGARRPLSVGELNEALRLDGPDSDYVNLLPDVRRACGCLITVEDDQVRFSHSSVKRFLLESEVFKQSPIYDEFMEKDLDDHLAQICTNYLFNGERSGTGTPRGRFQYADPDTLGGRYPFMKYVALHWIEHCSASDPLSQLNFIRPLREFVTSRRLLEWCETVSYFIEHESFSFVCGQLQDWVLALSLLGERNKSYEEDLKIISARLRHLWRFLDAWGGVVGAYPAEIYTLSSLIESPSHSTGSSCQNTLLLKGSWNRRSRETLDLLDKRRLPRMFDRFLLSDLNIFMWSSLMPSTPWDNAELEPLDPEFGVRLSLITESISMGGGSTRTGLEAANIGRMLVTTVLRRDLRAVAIAWVRYVEDDDDLLWVKTYAWLLQENDFEEDSRKVNMQRIWWTDYVDPCRVDLTHSSTFKDSRGAVAFSDDLISIWTAGGMYNLATGRQRIPPAIFSDSNISALTFSRNATIIAGVRASSSVEIYDLPKGELKVATEGCAIIGVSYSGKYVLYMRFLEEAARQQPRNVQAISSYEICLLSRQYKCKPLWQYRPPIDGDEPTEYKRVSLQYFYNNGGMYAFSESENMLVMCIPTSPEWSLMAFELDTRDPRASSWTVELSNILEGAGILSFSFCPLHEKRLYVLDGFSNIRTVEISRESSSSSTIRTGTLPPVLSGLTEGPDPRLLTITFQEPKDDGIGEKLADTSAKAVTDTVVSKCWNPMLLEFVPLPPRSFSYLRHFFDIKSSTLMLSLDPVMKNALAVGPFFSPRWRRACVGAQRAIEATMGGLETAHKGVQYGPEKEAMKPKVTTNVTFDEAATVGFFQSVIYYPSPTVRSQSMWDVSMIMDIRSLETPKARKTGNWLFLTIGTVYEEMLAAAYHDKTRLLAYSVCLSYIDKTREQHRWFHSRLCICEVGVRNLWDNAPDPRGTFLTTRRYQLDYADITQWQFSDCGRYLYGISCQYPTRIIQFDVWEGFVTRTIINPFHIDVLPMGFSLHQGHLYALANTGCTVVLVRLPLTEGAKYEQRTLAVGPSALENCTQIRLLWPQGPSGRYVVIEQGPNYLRKNDKLGGNIQWPMLFSMQEDDLGDWMSLEEEEDKLFQTAQEEERKAFRKWAGLPVEESNDVEIQTDRDIVVPHDAETTNEDPNAPQGDNVKVGLPGTPEPTTDNTLPGPQGNPQKELLAATPTLATRTTPSHKSDANSAIDLPPPPEPSDPAKTLQVPGAHNLQCPLDISKTYSVQSLPLPSQQRADGKVDAPHGMEDDTSPPAQDLHKHKALSRILHLCCCHDSRS